MRPPTSEHLLSAAAALLLVSASVCLADVFGFDRKADWDQWTFPRGAVAHNDDGSIGLGRIDKATNAVSDAFEFRHLTRSSKDPIAGGIRVVGSGQESADNIIDGRSDTWWQPSQDHVIEDWFVEIDLGRMILATKIRLTFPDTLNVRPFRSFSLYTSDGVRATAARDVFQFTRVGRPSEPNEQRVVEYELHTIWPGGATGEHLVAGDTLSHAMVQYVRFVAEERNVGAALAQIEVVSLGDNAVLGSVERGGGVRGGTDLTNLSTLIDGDKNTTWSLSGPNDWVSEGHWFEIDLGASYWIDRAFMHISRTRNFFGSFEIATSDGTQAAGVTTDRVRGNFDFQPLTQVDNTGSPLRLVFDFQFPLRKTRYAFFHRLNFTRIAGAQGGTHNPFYSITEFMLFGDGYVAGVEMQSDFIDLGGTKSIRKLSWDAELPPETFVEIRSQTGDTFLFEEKYYNKNGIEISQAQWNKLPKSQKQDVVEIQRKGPDWSGWSQVYDFPEEVFLSPTPRRFVQLQVKLGNDNPAVAPLLRGIYLHFDDALISGGVTSRILPRQAGFDSLQTFSYVLKPTFRAGDLGFDRVHILTSSAVEDVSVKVGGSAVAPVAVAVVGDSLRVDLPRRVLRDSVEILFQTRIRANATAFDAWVSLIGTGARQGVRPAQQHAATVFVPAVASGNALIRSVDVASLVTPNGDGVNDVASIRFTLAKVESTVPEVTLYDLSGRPVRVVAASVEGYEWDGRDSAGRMLPPGVYICRIAVTADVGVRSVRRTINLAY
jgi:hypothetical protein